jgi:predicted HD superfamily hydrolase involved in NAD metabolism
MMDIIEIRKNLKETLPDRRFRHILGAEETSAWLGGVFHEDADRLRTAALLHDCAKYMKKPELLEYAVKNGILLTEDDRKAAGIIHAKIGAYIAAKQYLIKDKEILDSIAFHSTGAPDMTRFQKIIFASDYLEPNRGFEENKSLRELIVRDFEKGVFEIIKRKLRYVLERGDYLHPLSLDFYNHQLMLIKAAE